MFLRRLTQPSNVVYNYHVYRDVHLNAPVSIHNQSTTTTYSHSNNTTTTTIKDAYNDNSTSLVNSEIDTNSDAGCMGDFPEEHKYYQPETLRFPGHLEDDSQSLYDGFEPAEMDNMYKGMLDIIDLIHSESARLMLEISLGPVSLAQVIVFLAGMVAGKLIAVCL